MIPWKTGMETREMGREVSLMLCCVFLSSSRLGGRKGGWTFGDPGTEQLEPERTQTVGMSEGGLGKDVQQRKGRLVSFRIRGLKQRQKVLHFIKMSSFGVWVMVLEKGGDGGGGGW